MSEPLWPAIEEWQGERSHGGVYFDLMLAQGWECVGPVMHRGPIVNFGEGSIGLVPIRKPLVGELFSKNQRKRIARNQRRFTTVVSDRPDLDAAEALYALARPRFLGPSYDSLEELAGRYADEGGPELVEVSVFDGARLAAVSYLLVGAQAGYSLIGVFHPDYARHSLGTHTLFEEIALLKARGATHYYPGHFMLGNTALDYKLRLRSLEYLHWNQGWCPMADFDRDDHPVTSLARRLERAASDLRDFGVQSENRDYPFFSIAGFYPGPETLLAASSYLDLGPLPFEERMAAIPRLDHSAFKLARLRKVVGRPELEDALGEQRSWGPILSVEPLSAHHEAEAERLMSVLNA